MLHEAVKKYLTILNCISVWNHHRSTGSLFWIWALCLLLITVMYLNCKNADIVCLRKSLACVALCECYSHARVHVLASWCPAGRTAQPGSGESWTVMQCTEWGLDVWLATTGDSADLAVCHLIRCSNSSSLFFSSFCSKCVPVGAPLWLVCYILLFQIKWNTLRFCFHRFCAAMRETQGSNFKEQVYGAMLWFRLLLVSLILCWPQVAFLPPLEGFLLIEGRRQEVSVQLGYSGLIVFV